MVAAHGRYREAGILPRAGGWDDQDALYAVAMQVLDGELGAWQEEQWAERERRMRGGAHAG